MRSRYQHPSQHPTLTNTNQVAALLSLKKKPKQTKVTFKESVKFCELSQITPGNFSERKQRKMLLFPSAVNRNPEFLLMVARSHLSLKSGCLFL